MCNVTATLCSGSEGKQPGNLQILEECLPLSPAVGWLLFRNPEAHFKKRISEWWHKIKIKLHLTFNCALKRNPKFNKTHEWGSVSLPNFIASFHSNPLRNGTILFLLLGQESLDPESLVRRLGRKCNQFNSNTRTYSKIRNSLNPRNIQMLNICPKRFSMPNPSLPLALFLTSPKADTRLDTDTREDCVPVFPAVTLGLRGPHH